MKRLTEHFQKIRKENKEKFRATGVGTDERVKKTAVVDT